jgi:hypothetical protein
MIFSGLDHVYTRVLVLIVVYRVVHDSTWVVLVEGYQNRSWSRGFEGERDSSFETQW